MEKNQDGSNGPGLQARENLKFSDGDTFEPIKSGMLFLAYWFEKRKNQKDYVYFLGLGNDANASFEQYARVYNGGGPGYDKKIEEQLRLIVQLDLPNLIKLSNKLSG